MLFTKDLKGFRGVADKGCVSTLAHTTMTAARPADSGLAGSGELDRYSYADAPGADRGSAPASWDGAEAEIGRVGRRAAGNRGRGLHGQLVQQLGQMIVSGDLGADRPLVPEEIGQRFEVSRTVVRESLRVLEAKGLVSARPNVGTRVRPVSDWNLLDPDIIEWRAFGPQRDDQRRELCELRWTIEPLAARLAAGHGREEVQQRLADMVEIMNHALAQGDSLTFSRADAEFHALLLQVGGNRMLEHLAGIVAAALHVSGAPISGCDRLTEAGVAHHRRIVEAIGEGDATAAEAAMRQLLTVHPDLDHAEVGVPAPREH
ncbi:MULTISPECIES: FadR/GntR family transcriptional regulator [Streptomyces]|nr:MULTISPECIES: FadR/GntR family transcriptional regulator [Streptomyces]MYU16059.1 FCD domain-containing protein [Streptomyces sp. SID8361]MYX54171.1 FCD domain-containing protein [Streptomyces sp. SID8382]AQA14441.1 GntR family transcriptional regulator [Streptomyces autolyticus]AUA10780.1 HTH-type transcriptional regulator LutR [Streptomyces sp. M56]QDL70382.1 FadR family transcriptional regulator [Streptomyces malaysiensis]